MDIEVFNLAEIMRIAGDDLEFVKELLTCFFDVAPAQVEKIRQAIIEHDAAAVSYNAHAIKGAAGNIRAETTSKAARKLEEIGKEGDLSNADEALSNLEVELEKLKMATCTL
jgi:two-component system, sensor histidine kinase and response regulator